MLSIIGKIQLFWAKNFNIPFRSNLKLTADKIFTVDHQNNLYF